MKPPNMVMVIQESPHDNGLACVFERKGEWEWGYFDAPLPVKHANLPGLIQDKQLGSKVWVAWSPLLFAPSLIQSDSLVILEPIVRVLMKRIDSIAIAEALVLFGLNWVGAKDVCGEAVNVAHVLCGLLNRMQPIGDAT